MSEQNTSEVGSIAWHDLTVPNADQIRSFYSEVVGWKPDPVDMGGYQDFNMNLPASGTCAAGICHARGSNENLPPQWLVYITVEDVDESAKRCVELGGKIVVEPRGYGGQARFCVIRDPAGAVAALYAPDRAD